MYTKFEDSGTHRCWAVMMEKNHWNEKKWTNKGTDKPYVADSLIHSTTCHVCTNFQNPRHGSSFEKYLKHKTLIGKKEKRKNKGTDKQYVAEFFIHSINCYV